MQRAASERGREVVGEGDKRSWNTSADMKIYDYISFAMERQAKRRRIKCATFRRIKSHFHVRGAHLITNQN